MNEQALINALTELAESDMELKSYSKHFDISVMPTTYFGGHGVKIMIVTAEQQMHGRKLQERYDAALKRVLEIGHLYRIPKLPPPVVST